LARAATRPRRARQVRKHYIRTRDDFSRGRRAPGFFVGARGFGEGAAFADDGGAGVPFSAGRRSGPHGISDSSAGVMAQSVKPRAAGWRDIGFRLIDCLISPRNCR